MPTAPADHQRRLLEVQDADVRLTQSRHRRDTHPLHAEIENLNASLTEMADARVTSATEVADIKREVTKAEDDVAAVRVRVQRDQQRLDSGQVSAKDAMALTSELELLARRLSDLEDLELDVMQRLEDAEAAHALAVNDYGQAQQKLTELTAQLDDELGVIDAEISDIEQQRSAAAAGIDDTLLTLYERLRTTHGGVGAARLQHGSCQGCHMTLNSADLQAIDAAAPDQVVRCEECGRILIRERA